MKQHAKRSVIVAITLLLAVPAAWAAPSAELADWGRGPARFLMTDSEARQWQNIATDVDARAFIALFWARRDPTPDTPVHEFLQAFDARVKYADEHFKEVRSRGSLTDRGKVLILLGPPTHATLRNVLSAATPGARPSQGELAGVTPIGHSEEAMRTETWNYEGDNIPAFSGKRPFDIVFVAQHGSDEFRLGSNRINVGDLFDKAVDASVISPDLTAPRTFEPVVTAPPTPEIVKTLPTESIRAAYGAYVEGGRKDAGGVFFTSGEFVTSDGDDFTAIQLFVPAAVASMLDNETTFFGQVELSSGEPELAWEAPAAEAGTSKEDRWLDRSLGLPAGEHMITVGLARDGKILGITGGKVEVKGLEAETPGASPLFLSNNIFPLDRAQNPTDPFAFGGLKVVPKGDHLFTTADELWYFVELRHPGLGEEGAPAIQVKIDVDGKTADKPVRMAAPMAPVSLMELRGVPGHYGIGTAIPLATFKPGDYTIKLKIFDSIRKETWNYEENFKIVE